MKTCKHCNKDFSSDHYCHAAGRTIDYDDDDGDFLLSAVVGYATNSAILGGLIGGSFAGGIVGDILDGGSLFD